MQQDVMSFRERFTTFDGNKVMQEPLPYMGENVSAPSFLLPIMEVKNMLIRNVQVAHNFSLFFYIINSALLSGQPKYIVTAQVCHQAYLPG